jgi:hypothetical protein
MNPTDLVLTPEVLDEHDYLEEAAKLRYMLAHRKQLREQVDGPGPAPDEDAMNWLALSALGGRRFWEVYHRLNRGAPIPVHTAVADHSNFGSGRSLYHLGGPAGLPLGTVDDMPAFYPGALPRCRACEVTIPQYRYGMDELVVWFDPERVTVHGGSLAKSL